MKNREDFLNKNNGSAHPFAGGGVWKGTIVGVGASNTVSVRIPALSVTIGGCPAIGVTKLNKYKVGDSVICAFLNNGNEEVAVLGRYNIALDVFGSKVAVQAITAALVALDTRVTTLEANNP